LPSTAAPAGAVTEFPLPANLGDTDMSITAGPDGNL
jgi:hypothetical protein